jgi:sec-independent protein translocase protein TatC
LNRENSLNEKVTSFWEHARELQIALLSCCFIIAIGTGVAFFFYKEIFAFITAPLTETPWQTFPAQEIKKRRITHTSGEAQTYTLPPLSIYLNSSADVQEIRPHTYRIPPQSFIEYEEVITPEAHLLLLHPVDGLLLTTRISLWVGIVWTSPAWIYVLLRFLFPALHSHEKRLLIPLFLCILSALIGGGAFAYYVIIPLSNHSLTLFNQNIGTNWWAMTYYVDYIFLLFMGTFAVCALSLLLLCLVHFCCITADFLESKRRHAIILIFILGALFTPPDVLSQFLMALPLMGMYEMTILYGKWRFRQQERLN